MVYFTTVARNSLSDRMAVTATQRSGYNLQQLVRRYEIRRRGRTAETAAVGGGDNEKSIYGERDKRLIVVPVGWSMSRRKPRVTVKSVIST